MTAPPTAEPALDRRRVGIGWRQPHEAELLQRPPVLGFIEVHSENFFGAGGAALATLVQARTRHAVSLHGVGLGLGSAAGIDPWHLDRLAALVERIDPVRVSDHACFARAPWPGLPGQPTGSWVHASDLLPIAFDEATLARMARHVQQVQERLRRPILVENLSAYLRSAHDTLAEAEFFNQLARRSGCALLLDVNNLVVNGLNAVVQDQVLARTERFLAALDPAIVGQIHLAGHARVDGWAIDDHGSPVPDLVWQAYRRALAHCGAVPTLIEWDTDLPAFEVLLGEADQAARMQQAVCGGEGWGDGGGEGGVQAGATAASKADSTTARAQGAAGRALAAGGVPVFDTASAAASGMPPARLPVAEPSAAEAAQTALVAALWTPVDGSATGAEACAAALASAGWLSVRGPEGVEPGAAGQVLSNQVAPSPTTPGPTTPGPAAPGALVPGNPHQALAIYRANARAVARRALAAAYPTVAALVGEQAWAAIARRHWLAVPPDRGDLAEWGAALPQALAADAQLVDCPYLGDVARLDWAVHRAATAADATAAAIDLAALAGAPPERWRLQLVAGAALIVSAWPVVSLRQAHQSEGGIPWAEAAQALAEGRAQTAWVWRPAGAWRVATAAVSTGDAACLQALLDGTGLADALDAALAAEPEWRFDQWLVRAVAQRWLASAGLV